ncbi:MAG: hypothetical protein DCC75_00150 [Proteobacteria bacterium]|nr:MAG: hypothetical protein DCC75_00150 [Pseudomonadota bacterium]
MLIENEKIEFTNDEVMEGGAERERCGGVTPVVEAADSLRLLSDDVVGRIMRARGGVEIFDQGNPLTCFVVQLKDPANQAKTRSFGFPSMADSKAASGELSMEFYNMDGSVGIANIVIRLESP